MDLLPLLGQRSDHYTAIIIEEPHSYVGREVGQEPKQVHLDLNSRGYNCLSVCLSGDPGPAAVLRCAGEESAELGSPPAGRSEDHSLSLHLPAAPERNTRPPACVSTVGRVGAGQRVGQGTMWSLPVDVVLLTAVLFLSFSSGLKSFSESFLSPWQRCRHLPVSDTSELPSPNGSPLVAAHNPRPC